MARHSAIVCILLCLAGYASASTLTFSASLSGSNEIPNVITSGTGSALVLLDETANTLELFINFTGLNSPTQAAHIHCCVLQPANTGVATTVPAFLGFPLGVTFGSYHNVLNLLDSGTYNPAFVTAQGSLANAHDALIHGLETGQTYLNIHTTTSPGGEIRGVLVATPEPTTAFLVVPILALFGWIRRRRV